jgi:hypothetical protein
MEQGSILPFLKKPRPDASRQDASRPESSRSEPYQRPPATMGNLYSKCKSKRQHKGTNNRRNMELEKIADETIATLPSVLRRIPNFDAVSSSIHNHDDTDAVDPSLCPGFKNGATIQVLDIDSFDAALVLNPNYTVSNHSKLLSGATDTETLQSALSSGPERPVAVLNLASELSPGGGWKRGALAQEECLCYRSSLHLSLHDAYYPLPSLYAIHSPNVVLVRDSMATRHALLASNPEDLPAVSVISVAALRQPELTHDEKTFKSPGARTATKRKIRIALRVAAMKGHTKLVLGALGCGVFR